jgi:predicted cation transporter
MDESMGLAGLYLIFFVVLLGPFFNKKIESNLEAFLFVMGISSATL